MFKDILTKIGYIRISGISSANFSGNPVTGYLFLTVNFTDLSQGLFDSWYWNFGDGKHSTEQNPTHYYAYPGFYTVSLMVSGLSGAYITIKDHYVIIRSTCTYDIAPIPEKIMYLRGSGIVNKKDIGVEIKRVTR